MLLDTNYLPSRYSQNVITQFFTLISDEDTPSQGIDFQTFMYLDYALTLFEVKNATQRWKLNPLEFLSVLQSPKFPIGITNQINLLPTTNFTNMTYNMYTYQNIPNFNDEQDFLLKFIQTNEATEVKGQAKGQLRKTKTRSRALINPNPIYNYPTNSTVFYLPFISDRLFNLIDVNSDGLLEWYDFGNFFQVFWLFNKFDPQMKGHLTAGEALEKFVDYSDFPKVNHLIRFRSKRLAQINQDTYVDPFSILTLLRIDDIVTLYVRRSDPTTLYEVELKRVLLKANLNNITEGILNKCLRGTDLTNVPKYDWECAFTAALIENIRFYESAAAYNTAKMNNITLTNTMFYNVDPTLGVGQPTPLASPIAPKRRFY